MSRIHSAAPTASLTRQAAACLALTCLFSATPVALSAPRVDARPLAELRGVEIAEAPATVASLNLVTPAAEIAARIEAIPVLPGTRVAAGDVLVRLDCQRHELLLARSGHLIDALIAQRELASAQLRRADKLVKQKNASEELVDQRRSELRRLDAELAAQRNDREQRERDVADCELRAPFDGILIERLLNVGDYATVGTPVIRLLDDRNIEVSAQVLPAEAEALQAAEGPVFIQSGQRYPLQLRAVTAAQDPVTRTREARLTFTANRALPGSAGRLQWQDRRPSVPAHLLVARDEQLGIFIIVDGKASFVAIPDAIEGRPARLPTDPRLTDTTPVITTGRHALHDGVAVETVSADDVSR